MLQEWRTLTIFTCFVQPENPVRWKQFVWFSLALICLYWWSSIRDDRMGGGGADRQQRASGQDANGCYYLFDIWGVNLITPNKKPLLGSKQTTAWLYEHHITTTKLPATLYYSTHCTINRPIFKSESYSSSLHLQMDLGGDDSHFCWHLAWQPLPSVCECVCEFDKWCKAFGCQ